MTIQTTKFLSREKIKEIFDEFCKTKRFTERINSKEQAIRGEITNSKGETITGKGLSSAIMIAEFPCSHNLLTSTSKIGRLKDKTQNKACPMCHKAYYFNHTNCNEWNLYGVLAHKTRAMNVELLHKFKPKPLPSDVYGAPDNLIGLFTSAATEYSEVIGVEEITNFKDTDVVDMAIYMFVGEDTRAYIGSTNNMHKRWHTSMNSLYGFKKEDMRCILVRIYPSTNNSRLREIEDELIKYFKLADGLGYNTTGAVETSLTNPYKWMI